MKRVCMACLLLLLLLWTDFAVACDHVDVDGELPVPAQEIQNPTETEPGYYPDMICPICEEIIVPGHVIPSIHEQECQAAGEHLGLVKDPGYPATCTEAGMTDGEHCEYCGKIIVAQEPVPATGHAWGNPAYTWKEDYSQATAVRICAHDGTHREEETVNSTAQTTEATYDAPGRIVYTAVVTHPAFATQNVEVQLPPLEPIQGAYSDATGNFSISGDGTALFTGPTGNSSTVTIPDSVAVNGGQVPVTAIADGAFAQNQQLTTVIIGKNVRTIGKKAFASCLKLKAVKGGAAVIRIRDSAFSGCKALKSFPVMGKLQTLDAASFRGCVKLTKFTLGSAVKSIGKNAFNGCRALKNVTVKTTKLKSGNVKAGAFKGIHSKVIFRCPKKKLKDYQTLFLKRGAPKTSRFK